MSPYLAAWPGRRRRKPLEETQPNNQVATSDYNRDDTLAGYTLTGTSGDTVSEWDYTYDSLYRVTRVDVPH